MAHRVLAVDDEDVVLGAVRKALKKQDYLIDTASRAEQALELLACEPYEVVITDLKMPGMDGLELLERVLEVRDNVQTIMITGYPTVKTALQAKRLGAFEYVTKPFTSQELRSVVLRAIRYGSAVTGEEEPPAPQQPERDAHYIPGHSWARIERSGMARIGLARDFAVTAGRVARLQLPALGDLLEQGRACVVLHTADDVQHTMHSPLSGRVVEVNLELMSQPELVVRDPENTGWMLRLEPLDLDRELQNLVPG